MDRVGQRKNALPQFPAQKSPERIVNFVVCLGVYSDGKKIDAGLLQLDNCGIGGSICSDVINNGILVFDLNRSNTLRGLSVNSEPTTAQSNKN